MFNPLYIPELREMLAENDTAGLAEFCTALHPARTAEFMEGLTAAEQWQVLRNTDPGTRSEIFGYLLPEQQIQILETHDPEEIGAFIGELPPDDRVDLLNQVDPDIVEAVLPSVPTEERRDILRLQAHAEGTAGAVMTTEIAKISDHCTVRQALEEIVHQAEELETIYYIYAVDDDNHLRGVVSARKLISTQKKPDTSVEGLLERSLVTVHVDDDQEKMAEKVARYDLLAIPVVDDEHRLLGIVTHDDVIDIVREEATEDAHRLSAVDPLQQGYLETPWLTLTWKRGMWLVILFFGALTTAFALQNYEGHMARVTWLVLFIPLVISSGGNSGSQSATLVITAMNLGQVRLSDWLRVVRRELIMGLCLGGFLGLLGYGVAVVVTGLPVSSLVVPLTLLLVVMCGTLIGAMLPLLFQRMGLDPALMSNPFVSGIVDIVGIVIYMNVALAML